MVISTGKIAVHWNNVLYNNDMRVNGGLVPRKLVPLIERVQQRVWRRIAVHVLRKRWI